MRRTFSCAALIAFAIGPLPQAASQPQPIPGAYKALGGAAIVDCQRFVVEMGKGPTADPTLGISVISWVYGYLTAYNETLAKSAEVGGDLSKGMTELEVINWIADWCSEHPSDIIASASRELVMHLYKLASSRPRP